MPTLLKLSRFFLTTALVVATLNTTNVNAMQPEQQKSADSVKLENLDLSTYLKENSQSPDAVLKLIAQLFNNYGHDKSVSLLKEAFAHAQMLIGDIRGEYDNHCLDILCNKTVECKGIHDLDYITIILCIADSDASNLVTHKTYYGGYSAWHCAIYHGRDDIVNLFINWANTNNMAIKLLSKKTKKQRTALHIAASNGNVEILQILLALANKQGIVEKLLNENDENRATVLSVINKYKNHQTSQEMLAIIKSYCTKYQLKNISLKSNDQTLLIF